MPTYIQDSSPEQDLSSRSRYKPNPFLRDHPLKPRFLFKPKRPFRLRYLKSSQFSPRPLSHIEDIRPLRVVLHRLPLPQHLVDEARRRQPLSIATQTVSLFSQQHASTQTIGPSGPRLLNASTQTSDPFDRHQHTVSTQTTPTTTPEPSPNSSLSEDELEEIRRFIVETSPSRQPPPSPEPSLRLPPHIQETFDEIDRLHLQWEEANQRSHDRLIRVQEHLDGITEILRGRSRR